jgi:N-sulfoglucosamine sulfohydrolase
VTVPPYLPDTPEVRADVAAFHGRVRAVDEGVAAVLDALERRGLSDSTVVVVTTDHGIAFPLAKGTLRDAGLEIALIVRWPGVTTPGARCDALVLNLDLFPTLLHAAGGDAPAGVDGLDLTETMQAGAAGRDRIFAQLHWHDAYVPMRAVRTERYKYVLDLSGRSTVYFPADVDTSDTARSVRAAGLRPPAREALYDLVGDPLEQRDLVPLGTHRDVLQTLRTSLLEWMEHVGDPLLAEVEAR